jgi:hypothetical protein
VPATLLALFTLLSPQLPPPVPEPGTVVVSLERPYDEVKGRLLGIDDTSVRLLVGRTSREVTMPIDRVRFVARVERDTVLDGAIIGALATGGLCALNCGQGSSPGNPLSGLILKSAAQGAIIGALIDSGLRKRTVIFRRAIK